MSKKLAEKIKLSIESGDTYINPAIYKMALDVLAEPSGSDEQLKATVLHTARMLQRVVNERDELKKQLETRSKGSHNGLSVGDSVIIYDRYRYAKPLKGIVRQLGQHDSGCMVEFTTGHPKNEQVGTMQWVFAEQLMKEEPQCDCGGYCDCSVGKLALKQAAREANYHPDDSIIQDVRKLALMVTAHASPCAACAKVANSIIERTK